VEKSDLAAIRRPLPAPRSTAMNTFFDMEMEARWVCKGIVSYRLGLSNRKSGMGN
jgi:hypothetical protein